MIDPPRLVTRRLILRPLSPADVPDLFASFADPEMMRWWSRGPFSAEEELAEYLLPPAGTWPGGRSWVIAEDPAGPAIGRLCAIDRGDAISELGYLVVRDRQGRGIAHEALGGLIDYLITVERRRRLFADVDPENVASNRLLARLGFTLEGRLREAWTTHIGRRDSNIWGLLADEWIDRPGT